MIEKGRHLRIHKDERFCPFCPNLIETEQHFLLDCNTLTPLRKALISEIKNIVPFFEQIQDNEKILILLSNEKVADNVGNYIQEALRCRTFLLNKHKNNV